MQLKLLKNHTHWTLEIHDHQSERDEEILIAGIQKLFKEPFRLLTLKWLSESLPSKKFKDFVDNANQEHEKIIRLDSINQATLKTLEQEIEELKKIFNENSGNKILDLKNEIRFLKKRIESLEELILLLDQENAPLLNSPKYAQVQKIRANINESLSHLHKAESSNA